MNLGTLIVSIVLVVIVALDVRYLYRSMKSGCTDCNGSCSSCGTTCKWTSDIEKAKKELIR
ncbi:MAG: FeoB-associated Cys-rich membrane protein [Solobacterium sp.]|nr:FeoB-associated Cys-rich membrane protein [Solobacterium sp.]